MLNQEIETIRESFEDFSSDLEDHRLSRNKLHSIEEILFLTLCAVICGCEGWRDIERYGKLKLDFLRGFFPYPHGVPSDDTLRRFFRHLDPLLLHMKNGANVNFLLTGVILPKCLIWLIFVDC